MGFENRRTIELYYDVDSKHLISSPTSGTITSVPTAYMTEEVSVKLHLLTNDSTSGYIPYELKDSNSAVFMATINAPDVELSTTSVNPVVGYAYGSDGTLIPETQIGTINLNTDFPLIASVAIGDRYLIGTNVTDDAGTAYTNTGEIFTAGQYIVWTGKFWYIKTGTPGPDELFDHLQGLNVLYDWIDIQRSATSYTVVTTDPLYNVITSDLHGLEVGDIIIPYVNGATVTPIGTSLTADTRYWVKEIIDVNTFKITAIPNGDTEVSLVGGTFYFKKSFANISKGRFSIRVKTTSNTLKTTWVSPLSCGFVLSSLTANDEVYQNAPPYFLSNLVVLPFTLNNLPWVQYDNLQPPDLVLTYPTTAAVLSMLSIYMHKITVTGATSKIPIIASGGELLPSLYTVDTIRQMDSMTAPLSNVSIDVGGFNYTLNNIGSLTLNANNTILKTLGLSVSGVTLTSGIITIVTSMTLINVTDTSSLITINGGYTGQILYLYTDISSGVPLASGGNILINPSIILTTSDTFSLIFDGVFWRSLTIPDTNISLLESWALR